MKDRFKSIRKSANLTQEQFGKKLGVSRSVIVNLEHGLTTPSDIFVGHVCEIFSVSRHWLETGEGDMYEQSPTDLIAQVAAEHNLGEGGKMLLRVLVRAFESLGPAALDQILTDTLPALMAERGLDPAKLAAERAEPINGEHDQTDVTG